MIDLSILKTEPLTTAAPSIEIQKKDFGTSDAYADNGWVSLFGGPFSRGHTGIEINPVSALGSGVVYSCIRILTGDCAKLPLRLMKLDEDGIWLEDRKHPLSRLLRRPNKRMTQSDWITSMVFSLLLSGNAYTAVLRDMGGKPTDLIPLQPMTVSLRENSIGDIFYTAISRLLESWNAQTFTEEDMVHCRAMSLDNGMRGASPVQLCSDVLGLSIATQELSATYFKNSANFNGFLTTDVKLNDDAIKQVSDAWNKNSAGMHNAWKTPVMGNGFDFKSVNMSPEQSQMIEARASIIREVAMTFGVPLYKLGVPDAKVYNSLDGQNIDYIDTTLRPILNPLEQSLNRTLLFDREFDDHKFQFDLTELAKGDIKTQQELIHQRLGDGMINVNQALKSINEPGIGPEGDIYTKPLNQGVLGMASALPMYQVNAPLKETETETAPATTPVPPKAKKKRLSD